MMRKQELSNPEDVPAVVQPEIADVIARATVSGAGPDLEYIGAGMTAVVLRSGPRSYKVARRLSDTLHSLFEAEAEFFAACARVPELDNNVALIEAFDALGLTIVKTYIERDPDVRPWQYEGGLWEAHRRLEAIMAPRGWTAPEYKVDSYVATSHGPVLVDGTFAHRVGRVLLTYAEELLSGERPWWTETPRDLAFALRIEVGRTLTAQQVEPLLARLPSPEE